METREERLERRRRERNEQVAYKLEQEIAVWDPAGIPNVTADPFKTLFVARIVSNLFHGDAFRNIFSVQPFLYTFFQFFQNYDTSESKLRREFEVYGPVKKVSDLNFCHIKTNSGSIII